MDFKEDGEYCSGYIDYNKILRSKNVPIEQTENSFINLSFYIAKIYLLSSDCNKSD